MARPTLLHHFFTVFCLLLSTPCLVAETESDPILDILRIKEQGSGASVRYDDAIAAAAVAKPGEPKAPAASKTTQVPAAISPAAPDRLALAVSKSIPALGSVPVPTPVPIREATQILSAPRIAIVRSAEQISPVASARILSPVTAASVSAPVAAVESPTPSTSVASSPKRVTIAAAPLPVVVAPLVPTAAPAVTPAPVSPTAVVPTPAPALAESNFDIGKSVVLGDLIPTDRDALYRRRAASVDYQNVLSTDLIRDLAELSGIDYMVAEFEPSKLSLKMRRNPFQMLEMVVDSLGMGLVRRNDTWLITAVDKKKLTPHTYALRNIHLDREFSFRETDAKGSSASTPARSNTPSNGGGSSVSAGTYEKVTDRSSTLAPRALSNRAAESSVMKRIQDIVSNGIANAINPVADKPLLNGADAADESGKPADGSIVDYDPDANSLFIVTTEQKHEWVKEYLAAIDQEPVNIEVLVQFISTGTTQGKDMGVDWSGTDSGGGLGRGIGVNLSGAAPAGTETNSGPSLFNPISFGDLSNLMRPTAILSASSLELKLRALASNSATKVSKRPKLVTQNNREMVLNITTNRPVVVQSNMTNNTGGGAVTTAGVNVSNESVGTVIRILPQRIRDGAVKLNVQIEVTNVVSSVIFSGVEYPVIARTSVSTSPIVTSGYTVDIGGLEELINKESVKKVPLLGDLPFFGFPFREIVKNNEVSSLSLLLTVKVTDRMGRERVYNEQVAAANGSR